MVTSFQVDDYEIGAFFGLVMVFDVCERLWPGREVDRVRDLKLDVLSFAFALAVNRICTHLMRAIFGIYHPLFHNRIIQFLQHLPAPAKILAALFVVDFIIYWIHRAQHNHNGLWRTHAWHHSIEQMYWFAGFRTSFLHSFIYNIPQAVIPVTLFRLSPIEAGIGYSIGLLIQFWEHTNLRVKIGPLKYLIITPEYHRLHHSATIHRGQNLGTTFSLWDRMFGTFVDPEKIQEEYPLGLGTRVEPKELPRMLLGV
jgi:sterol desaturase/sphingolipid hydroxylase (fatty acid hydroxylase superfamily)